MVDPQSVRALQDQLKTKLMEVMQSEFQSSYPDSHRVAMWCGSLVVQAVVGRFASQLRQYFKRNTLELNVNGLPVRFAPQEQSIDAKPPLSASAVRVTETEIDFGVLIGVIVVVLTSLIAFATALLLLHTRFKRKASYYANSGVHRSTHRWCDRSSRAVTIVVNPLTVKGTPAYNGDNPNNPNPNPNGEEGSKESFGIEMSDMNIV